MGGHTLVGHSCGTLLWDTLVEHSCEAFMIPAHPSDCQSMACSLACRAHARVEVSALWLYGSLLWWQALSTWKK